jgi:nucleotide-binding universal stress UspA family protein
VWGCEVSQLSRYARARLANRGKQACSQEDGCQKASGMRAHSWRIAAGLACANVYNKDSNDRKSAAMEVVMFKKVLVPFDESEHAQHALQMAFKLCEGDEPAKVIVLKVAPPMDFDDSTFEIAARMAGVPQVDKATLDEARANYMDAHKKEVQEKIEEYFSAIPENIDVQIVVKNGRPHDEICEFAKEHEVECIVMGRRGLGAIRAALGSVSSAVLRSTDLPVLVVK